jgi:GNAT superfamily N-acetyltransferase
MALEIRSASEPKDFTRFVDLPYRLYRNDPTWVPLLKDDIRLLFDRVKNPFFDHAEAEPFLALRDGRVVGRIAAIDNRAHNEFHGDRVGFFGFFECEDDPEAAAALFDRAEEWVRAHGKDRLRGPMNFSTNDDCGSLIDGFSTPPTIMMPHNPPYHARLYEHAGFVKEKDLLAYWIPHDNPPERIVRGVELIRKRKAIVTRSMDMKRFDAEVDLIRDIYNSAWEKNWGFVPMTQKEIEHMAKQLKPVVDPEMVVFAEIAGKPIAFALGLPDFNIALKHAGGSLFPFGFLAILYWQRKIHQARVLTLGIKEGYRGLGIDALLIYEMFVRGHRRGYTKGEFSWILEDNYAMRRPLESTGAIAYKTYRVYERLVPAPKVA